MLVSRLLTFPRTPWELDEFHFLEALSRFEPLRHHPHPPGYPLFVALGKFANLLIPNPFAALVALNIVACVVGFAALYRAFRNYVDDADVALAGSLIFYLSAGMLIHATLALADATALMFLALTFHSLSQPGVVRASGAPTEGAPEARTTPALTPAVASALFASASIGCRPQLAIPLVPALIVALFLCFRTWKQRAIAIAVFTVASLIWLVPLIQATGGWKGFTNYELGQARYFAAHDAAASRGSKTLLRIAARFVLRAWGSSITIALIGLFAAIGVIPFLRGWRRSIIPFVVFTFEHLGFAIAAMDPADAVRYSLPALPLFALLAALGLRFVRIPWWIGTAVIVGLSAWYVSPIVIDRVTTPSPIVAAARYVNASVPRNTVVLYQAGTRSHVEWLLPLYRSRFLERAMLDLYDQPATPAVIILDGGSVDRDARVFAWHESNAYVKMTRNFGLRVSVDPLRPEERFLEVFGVHHLEATANEGEWRWLGPEATIRLPQLGRKTVALQFSLSIDAPYESNAVEVLVDGQRAAQVNVPKKPVWAIVPFGKEITIRSARSFRPDDVLHNQDRRRLAVQLTLFEQR
ncbi:MAG: hypothetical protein DMF56_10455 [Acidobacteria bacterium]|nr:MAG: hypothetical protein DMF56_10455 [Acidobacteriota bacterium]